MSSRNHALAPRVAPIARVRQQGQTPWAFITAIMQTPRIHRPRPRLKVRPRTPSPYHEIQKRIGMILREQYEPPKELPHQLLVLLIKADKQKGDKLRYEAAN